MTSSTTLPASPDQNGSQHKRNSLDFLRGGGEMGALIREMDWCGHPLGKPENWPQSLKTAVSLILNSQHPMWIGWGREMSFLYNDAYLHVLGLAKHPWALGRPASEVWSEIWHVCGPLADKVFCEGEASFVDDVRLFMNRGEFLEETYYSFSYSPIRDEAGQVGGLFCPSNDVTPKVIGARRLHTLSELSSNVLVEKTADAACAIAAATLAKNRDDVPFALLYLIKGNRALLKETVGIRQSGDLLASPVVDLTGEQDATWPLAEVFRSGEPRVMAVEISDALPRGTADQIVSNAIVLPMVSRVDRKMIGLLVAGLSPARRMDADYRTFLELIASHVGTAIQNARAAEEEKKRADALAEIDRAKTTFFSNVSHEFRTPLTLMLGPLENLLAKGDALAAKDREEIATAHRNSLRLLKLVNSLLDFSRIEAGRIQASFAPVDLCAVTAELASNFRSAMEMAGLKLEIDCKPLHERVYVDHDMWEKIVLNLLSNAFKFTFEGSVTVRIEDEGNSAVLTVADTGTGIPEPELPRIFERFHRVEGAKGRTYEGTGIGLALIQELVKLHGGSVTVKSRVGEGSAFSVSLPFGSTHLPKERTAAETAQVKTSVLTEAFTGEALTWIAEEQLAHSSERILPPEPRVAQQEGGRARILVADDNADMREHVAHILGAQYDVTSVADGRAALEEVRRVKPDLVVSDVMMPQLDGFGVLRELRADSNTVDIPVIMLSARAGEEARTEGMGAGADDYLVKPFSARELVARVAAHLKLAQMRQEAKDQSTRLLESITNGFFALDREWRFTYMNAEAERLNGIRRDELLGRNHWEIFPEAIGTTVYKELTHVMNERVPTDFQNYFAPWDRWFHIRAYPAAGGGITVFFDDVTEHKRAEADRDALSERERAARDEAETLNEVAQALSGELDLQKLVQKATDAATRLTGAKFGAFFYNVVNQEGESYMLYTLSGAPREAFEKFGMMPRNTSVFGPTFSGERVVRSGDILKHPDYGKTAPYYGMPPGHLPVRSYLAVAVKSRSGEVLGGLFFGHPEPDRFSEGSERLAIGIASHAAIAIDNARLFQLAEQELAQRKEIEKSLRRSEERFRGVFHSSAIGVAVLTSETRFLEANAAFCDISGYPEHELTAIDYASLMHPEDWVVMQAKLADLLSGRASTIVIEQRYFRKDGRMIWASNTISLMRDAQGRPEHIIAFCQDITERKRADRASRLLGAIVDSSDDAIISKDLNGVITSWNKSAQRLFGYTAEEAIGQSVASLLIPLDRQDEEPDILAHLRRGERVDHFETVRRRKDGTLLDISLTISPVRDADGIIIGASKIARDIGYRKRTERLDQEQKRLLEMIASGRPFEDCLVALTEAVDRLRPGIRTAVLMSSHDGSATPRVFSAHLPLWREETLLGALVRDSLMEGNAASLSCRDIAGSDEWSDEWKKLFLANGIRACHSVPILISGRPVGSFLMGFPEAREPEPWELRIADFGTHAAGIAIERERVAAALRRSEQDFRALVEVGPQIIWLSGPQGELEFVNRRWIEFSGLDRESTKDPEQISLRLHPEDKLLEHWQKSVAAGTPFELEARLRGRDGEFRWFMMRSVPVRDEQGRILKWFGTSTDIHQNKLLQLQLRSANRDLEQFAYSVSHDLREPLRSVKLFSELLTRRYRDKFDGQALEFLEYLRTGASRMEMLVRDLLSYTQAIQPGSTPQLYDASKALRDALSNLAQAIAESGATIEFDPLPKVPVHGTQLQQLFQNLVGNAIKYHRPGILPMVRVCTQRQKDEWLFSVSDNGIGIESEYKERIFGLFKRLHTGDEYSGSGIGLALCQRIVERHNGRIWVESEPGKGSTFYFTLPG